MQRKILHLADGSLAYHEYGNGSEIWIALHGFAQTGEVFSELLPHLPAHITLIALDLPWHGESEWTGDIFLLKTIQSAMDTILTQKGAQKYTLLGFSFGARLALALTTLEASRWSKLILLAPDGLPRRDWYAFFDQMPWWAKQWLSNLFNHAPKVLKVAEKMYQWGWLNAFSLKFMRQQLQSELQIRRLKGIWLSAALFPTIEKSGRVLTQKNLPVQLITGEQDKVIPSRAFAHLSLQIPHLQWLCLQGVGHDLLSPFALRLWFPFLFQDTHPNTHPE